MRKIYTPFILFFFSACTTEVKYLGTSYPETKNVDVYVTQSAVKKPFEIMGKGYVKPAAIGGSVETIQRRAVEKAKLQGANAVVIEDYYVVSNTSSVTLRTDSLRSSKSELNPAISSGLTILFLRYKE